MRQRLCLICIETVQALLSLLSKSVSLLRKMYDTLFDIVFRADPRPVALLLTIFGFVWGCVLVQPGDLFSNNNVGVYYSAMSELAPDYVWGWIFLILTSIKIVGLLSKTRWYFLYTMPNAFLWSFVALMVGRNGLRIVGPWLYLWFFLASMWVHARLTLDHRKKP